MSPRRCGAATDKLSKMRTATQRDVSRQSTHASCSLLHGLLFACRGQVQQQPAPYTLLCIAVAMNSVQASASAQCHERSG